MEKGTDSLPLIQVTSQIPSTRHLELSMRLVNYRFEALRAQLDRLNQTDGPILITINSQGGHYHLGIQLCRLFESSPNPVIGKVEERAWSAAFMALQGCTGGRLATTTSTLKIHNPIYFDYDTAIEWNTTLEEHLANASKAYLEMIPRIRGYRRETIDLLTRRTNLSASRIEEILDAAADLSATQALELGFLDAVIPTSL